MWEWYDSSANPLKIFFLLKNRDTPPLFLAFKTRLWFCFAHSEKSLGISRSGRGMKGVVVVGEVPLRDGGCPAFGFSGLCVAVIG